MERLWLPTRSFPSSGIPPPRAGIEDGDIIRAVDGESLEGKTVAQLWDYVFRGDEVFPLLEEGLKQRFPGVRFVSWKEFGSTHGSEEREVLASLPRRFKALGVDAVISGMGC